jgi:hypothetical protein
MLDSSKTGQKMREKADSPPFFGPVRFFLAGEEPAELFEGFDLNP